MPVGYVRSPDRDKLFSLVYGRRVTENLPGEFSAIEFLCHLLYCAFWHVKISLFSCLWPLLLRWFNINPSMDK